MLTFAQYSLIPKRKYVAAVFDEETQRKLMEYAMANGYDLTVDYDGSTIKPEQFEFHTTIFYSDSESILPDGDMDLGREYEAEATEFEMLGKDLDIPVLRVNGAPLRFLRQSLDNHFGMSDKWPEWKAHVSLSYSKELPETTPTEMPTFPLRFARLKIRDVNIQ